MEFMKLKFLYPTYKNDAIYYDNNCQFTGYKYFPYNCVRNINPNFFLVFGTEI